MKHNWTYKKLGELVNIRTGKLDANAASEGGKYPFFTCSREPLRIDTYSYDCECVLVAGNGELNVKYYKGKFDAYQRTYIIEKKPEVDYISTYYIYLFFQKYIDVLRSGSIGGIIKYIKLGDLTNAIIPIPSLDEQQAIVRELNGINHLIDLQEEQLREYDRLAQSLFYTTFGEEEKWQKATLKDICSSIIRGPFGSALKKDFFVPKSSDTYKVYEQKHAIQKNATIGAYYITKEKFEELKRFEVFPEDIIMSCSGTIGELFVIPLDAEKGVMNQALLKFHLNELATIPYFLFVMEYVKSKMTVQGCGLQNIGSVKEICKIDFPLPPLALQQSFAAQIEAIEQQKALIRRSLDETRTLLAARMQYYFE